MAFLGNGCAISKASASMMTQAIKGKIGGRGGSVRAVPRPGDDRRTAGGPLPSKLEVFEGVRAFPIRVTRHPVLARDESGARGRAESGRAGE